MLSIRHFRVFLGLRLGSGLLILLMAACSRSTQVRGAEARNADEKTPFHQDTGATANSSPGSSHSESQQSADASQREATATNVPFNSSGSREVGVGTLLTVRIASSVSSTRIEAGGTFPAVLDEPIIIDGDTVVSPGATVKGRVESARAAAPGSGSGYLRLTLESVKVAGKEIPLQTSSLFARYHAAELSDLKTDVQGGEPKPAHMRNAKLKKGRRLTFRLVTPLTLAPAFDESSRVLSSQQ
jgi:hypothetical protein